MNFLDGQAFLRQPPRVSIPGRKRQLFAVACCRRFAPGHFHADRFARARAVCERLADGAATEEEWRATQDLFLGLTLSPEVEAILGALNVRLFVATFRAVPEAAVRAARRRAWAEGQAGPEQQEARGREEEAAQARLLREVFGNPFRPSPPLPPEVRAWHDGTMVRLAEAMYDARDFSNMGLLADALLDAGCADEELLAHCRSGAEHVRGCWAVDLLLGKK
jgi:hypothetical protein